MFPFNIRSLLPGVISLANTIFIRLIDRNDKTTLVETNPLLQISNVLSYFLFVWAPGKTSTQVSYFAEPES